MKKALVIIALASMAIAACGVQTTPSPQPSFSGMVLGQDGDLVREMLKEKGYQFEWNVDVGAWTYKPNQTTIFALEEDRKGNISAVTIATDIPLGEWIEGLEAADPLYADCNLPLPHEDGTLEFFFEHTDEFLAFDYSRRKVTIYPSPELTFTASNDEIFMATYKLSD